MVFKLMLVDTHRDYVNSPNEMHEVLSQLFQANLRTPNPPKTFEIVWKMESKRLSRILGRKEELLP